MSKKSKKQAQEKRRGEKAKRKAATKSELDREAAFAKLEALESELRAADDARNLCLRQIAVFMKLPYKDVRKFYKEGWRS